MPIDYNALPYTHGLTGVNIALDQSVVTGLWTSMFAVIMIVLFLRTWQLLRSYVRLLYCLKADRAQQVYWSIDRNSFWPWLKRNIIYAPLGKKRHNREIQLSSAITYGTLPSRVHTLLLTVYIVSNMMFCALLDYGNPNKAAVFAEFRGRTGVLATVNLIPLVVLAGRNNPAIPLLKVSFDTYNLFHRWIGRTVAVETTLHIAAWYVNYISAQGQGSTPKPIFGTPFLLYGFVGGIAIAVMMIQSLSAVRHAFYETFVHLHQLLAVCTLFGIYMHLAKGDLPAFIYIKAACFIWLAERSLRFFRILYLNHAIGAGRTVVVVEAIGGEACRVTFQLPRRIHIRPGSHIYAYIPRLALWMSHPFSVAWTNSEMEPTQEIIESPPSPAYVEKQNYFSEIRSDEMTLPAMSQSPKGPTSVSLIVVARTGLTRRIYDKAMSTKGRTLHLTGYLEGPYAGHDCLDSYGTVIMFAGGAGITHHLIQIRHLLTWARVGMVATRKIMLVWSVRHADALAWVRPWMDEILSMEDRNDILRIKLFVTAPRRPSRYESPNSTIHVQSGRCSPGTILDQELPSRVGATMVTVCGPGSFADEVRAAVRSRLHLGHIDMNEESFTW